MLLHILFFITIFCFLYNYFTRTFNYWKGNNVKGPKPIPIFGNYKDVCLRRKHVGVLYSELYKQYPNENLVGLYRMVSPTLLIRDLDIVKQVLVKDFDSFSDRGVNYSKERLGDNLFHCTVEVTKLLRRHVTLIFTACKLKNHFYTDRADMFINYIEDITMKNTEIDAVRLFRKYTCDTILKIGFGIDVDPYNDENNVCDIMDAEIQTQRYYLETELLFPGSLAKLNLSLFSEKVDKFSREILKAGVNLQGMPKTEKNSIMDVLMGLRREGFVKSTRKNEDETELSMKVTDDLLAGQVLVLYSAGYENNSLSVTYALYHLAKNVVAQEMLIAEIDEVLQKHDGKFSYGAFKEMKYLHMVFEETLRMHPLTSSVSRNVGRDIQLEGTDVVVKRNTVVAISPYAIHHDEKYYPEPEKFKPERFTPKAIRERHPCAMLAFGYGPRKCFGSVFSQLQFGICMVKVFSKYRVEITKNTVKTIAYSPMRLLLTPSEKIYLRLVKRH